MDTTETTATAATPPATATGLLAEAKLLGRQALTALKTAIDTTFERTEAAIPTLTTDAAAYADQWVTDHVTSGPTRTYLKAALGIATPFEGKLDAVLVAGLIEANHVLTSRLDAFHAAT